MATKISTIPPKRLSETITAAATSFKLNDILGFDSIALSSSIVGDVLYASFQNTTGTIVELMKIDPTTIASTSITILKRGLSFNEDGTETEVSGNKLQWIKNQTIVNLGTDTPAMYNNYVKVADAQTINGVKTFGSIPVLPASDPTTDNQAVRKAYADTKLEDSMLDTDVTLAADSDTKIPSQKAVKTYADTKLEDSMLDTDVTLAADSDTKIPSQKAIRAYVDGGILQGAADSSTTVKGIGKVSVAPASPTAPIFVGDNDPRVPTQAENDALVGTGTPSSSNKYVTADTLLGEKYCGDGSDSDVTISSPTTLTRDMYYNNLTVTSTLTTDGYKIFVKGTLSGAGTIDWGTASAGSAGQVASNTATGGAGGGATGNGQFISIAGGAGGNSYYNGSTAGTSGAAATSSIGSSGSAGGNSSSSAGTGGASSIKTKFGVYSNLTLLGVDFDKTGTFTRLQTSGGSGGGGGVNTGGDSRVGAGGGAGATGGIVFIVANIWAGTFTIKSTGGAGGASGANTYSGGGGGGGNGGNSIVIYNTKTWSGSYNLVGGTAGANGGGIGGSAGTAGTAGISYEIELKTLTR